MTERRTVATTRRAPQPRAAALRRGQGVAEEHRDRHRPDSPGTGVMRPRSPGAPGSTSPDRLPVRAPVHRDADDDRSGLTMSAVETLSTDGGDQDVRSPRVRREIGRAREWQIVTVACSARSIIAIGLPTISLRPMTTASLPFSSTPCSASITARRRRRHEVARPGRAARRSARGSRRRPWRDRRYGGSSPRPCARGSGSWTSPSAASSAFSSATSSKSRSRACRRGSGGRATRSRLVRGLVLAPDVDVRGGVVAEDRRQTRARRRPTSAATIGAHLQCGAFPSMSVAGIARTPYSAGRARPVGTEAVPAERHPESAAPRVLAPEPLLTSYAARGDDEAAGDLRLRRHCRQPGPWRPARPASSWPRVT